MSLSSAPQSCFPTSGSQYTTRVWIDVCSDRIRWREPMEKSLKPVGSFLCFSQQKGRSLWGPNCMFFSVSPRYEKYEFLLKTNPGFSLAQGFPALHRALWFMAQDFSGRGWRIKRIKHKMLKNKKNAKTLKQKIKGSFFFCFRKIGFYRLSWKCHPLMVFVVGVLEVKKHCSCWWGAAHGWWSPRGHMLIRICGISRPIYELFGANICV